MTGARLLLLAALLAALLAPLPPLAARAQDSATGVTPEIEVTPLPPPGAAVDPAPLGEESVFSLPLEDGHLPHLPQSGRVVAELRGLDKVTGVARSFTVPVGGTAQFGRLRVRVMACHGREPDQPPEAAAFLHITDPLGDADRPVFGGWMFASSPGLSAMDHARYDVWVLHCRTS